MKLTNCFVLLLLGLTSRTSAINHRSTTIEHQSSIESSNENQATSSDENQNQAMDQEKVADKDSIRGILTNKKGDFDESLFQSLLTTNDKLPHLLFSDVTSLTKKIAQEFPQIVTLDSIGSTWHNQPINMLTLDAREFIK